MCGVSVAIRPAVLWVKTARETRGFDTRVTNVARGIFGSRKEVRFMSEELYDVAICGAGPAGSTAAILLAQQERQIVLIEGRSFPADDKAGVWLGAKAQPLLETLGIRDNPLFKKSFAQVTFYSADFTKTIAPAFDGPAGFLLNRGELDSLLAETARKAGATVADGFMIDQLTLEESKAVIVNEKEQRFESKLLMLATGRESPLVQRCGFRTGRSVQALWTAQVDHECDKEQKGDPLVVVVLGLNKRGSFGMICRHGKQLSLSVHWIGEPRDATPGLISMCKLAQEHDIIDVDLAKRAAGAPVIGSPASAALEYDSHVGKHSLLIGDAGGFVAAASNEGIYPAMWSAQIAADVINAALASPYSQDELMAFDTKWRIEMADYLRSPNTDPQFLLPLVFSNQAMADRMGAAFFVGENI